jgi:hypothetical protein
MKVEQGRFKADDNRPSAESEVHLRAYFSRKRLVGARSAFVLGPIACGVAVWSPVLGFDLAVGGLSGVVNMLLVMRNNERLLERGRSRSGYGLRNTLRIVAVGLVPVIVAAHHPWWYLLVAIAGFFAPLALYSFEYQREISTG